MTPFHQAVLFDLDGTLIETHLDFPAMGRVVREIAQAAGLSAESLDDLDILNKCIQQRSFRATSV